MSSSPPPPQLPPPPTVAIPPPRKFPAPCWTQEETLALINCYQDKWYSLRRRNLRTADWEAVAEEVGKRCPDQSPAKTSAQCRHKMEKLRKRYRTEKQRILSIPGNVPGSGRYFGSSWVFFDLIDSMELGSGGAENNVNFNMNTNMNMNNVVSNHLQVGSVSKVDLDVKPFRMNNMNMNTNMNVNDGSSKKADLGKYFDEMMMSMGNNNDNNNNNRSRNHEFVMRSPAPHMKFKVKNHHQHNNRGDYVSGGGGGGGDVTHDFDDSRDYMDAPVGFKRKPVNFENGMPISEERVESRKEKVSVAGEMVASVKMLGEGLIKMEKMKIEMMMDIEKMRMEMELKRSEMILESQHLIVKSFVQGLKKHHSSNNKVKVTQIE